MKNEIIDAIERFDTTIISRHSRPDGDAVGSTMGLYEILKASYPGKRIFLDNEDYAEYTSFLGDEGPHPSDADYQDALVIVVSEETGTISLAVEGTLTRGYNEQTLQRELEKYLQIAADVASGSGLIGRIRSRFAKKGEGKNEDGREND